MKQHPTLTDYYLTEDGRIYSTKSNKYLKSSDNGRGYLYVNINRKTQLIHRLVCETFVPNPHNLAEVNHKDGDKLNNNVSNLEWSSHRDNVMHAVNMGLITPPDVYLSEKMRGRR